MPKADEMKTQAKRAGFDDSGKPYKGVDPDTGERRTVVLSELKREFGPKTGEEMYVRIREALASRPAELAYRVEEDSRDLLLDGADPEALAKVNAILAGKE